jgi:hypothetical protein
MTETNRPTIYLRPTIQLQPVRRIQFDIAEHGRIRTVSVALTNVPMVTDYLALHTDARIIGARTADTYRDDEWDFANDRDVAEFRDHVHTGSSCPCN